MNLSTPIQQNRGPASMQLGHSRMVDTAVLVVAMLWQQLSQEDQFQWQLTLTIGPTIQVGSSITAKLA